MNASQPIPSTRSYALFDMSTPDFREPSEIVELPVDIDAANAAIVESNRESWMLMFGEPPVPGVDFKLEPVQTATRTQVTH